MAQPKILYASLLVSHLGLCVLVSAPAAAQSLGSTTPATTTTSAAAANASASASEWSDTFNADAVASQLSAIGAPSGGGALVAEAGEHAAGSRPAAAALMASLRKSGRYALVMDAASLGALDGIDDAAILARATALPVALVVVVRVFGASPGFAESAVTTFYAKDGRVLVALSAQRGSPLPPPSVPSVTGPPSSAATVAAIAVTPSRPPIDPVLLAAEKEYATKYITFRNPLETGRVDALDAVQGQGPGVPRRHLVGDKLYEALGRHDLTLKLRRGTRVRYGIVIAGAAVFVVGVVTAIASAAMAAPVLSPCTVTNPDGSCANNQPLYGGVNNTPGIAAGLTMMALGIGGLITSMAWNAQPIGAIEARRLAAAYNRKLKQELGIPVDETAPRPASSIRMHLSPVFTVQRAAESAGISLSMTY